MYMYLFCSCGERRMNENDINDWITIFDFQSCLIGNWCMCARVITTVHWFLVDSSKWNDHEWIVFILCLRVVIQCEYNFNFRSGVHFFIFRVCSFCFHIFFYFFFLFTFFSTYTDNLLVPFNIECYFMCMSG